MPSPVPTIYRHYPILGVILAKRCHNAHIIIEEIEVQGSSVVFCRSDSWLVIEAGIVICAMLSFFLHSLRERVNIHPQPFCSLLILPNQVFTSFPYPWIYVLVQPIVLEPLPFRTGEKDMGSIEKKKATERQLCQKLSDPVSRCRTLSLPDSLYSRYTDPFLPASQPRPQFRAFAQSAFLQKSAWLILSPPPRF